MKVSIVSMWFVAFAATAIAGCEREPTDHMPAAVSHSASAPTPPAPWEPVDEDFRGCEGG
jgi:hypothetical protein